MLSGLRAGVVERSALCSESGADSEGRVRDLFGREVSMEEARVLARKKPPTSRAALVILRKANGVHPHNALPLREPSGEKCGSCKHLFAHKWSKTYHKCGIGPVSHGPATDVRVRWPACVKWEAR